MATVLKTDTASQYYVFIASHMAQSMADFKTTQHENLWFSGYHFNKCANKSDTVTDRGKHHKTTCGLLRTGPCMAQQYVPVWINSWLTLPSHLHERIE